MRLEWDKTGEKFYETGIDQGVVYPQSAAGDYPAGYPWNGLIGVTQSPSGAETTPLYANNKKYLELMSTEEFGANVTAYTYPDEFSQCDGSAEVAPGVTIGQQNRVPFGMTYRTMIGNDSKGSEYGYKIHLIWNAKVTPSERAYSTINNDPSAMELAWDLTTTPVPVPNFKPTAHMEIDSTKVSEEALKKIEDLIYGTESEEARLPMPDEIIKIIADGNTPGA